MKGYNEAKLQRAQLQGTQLHRDEVEVNRKPTATTRQSCNERSCSEQGERKQEAK